MIFSMVKNICSFFVKMQKKILYYDNILYIFPSAHDDKVSFINQVDLFARY